MERGYILPTFPSILVSNQTSVLNLKAHYAAGGISAWTRPAKAATAPHT